MKSRLLALSTLLLAASASAISIAGSVQGSAPADLRVSAWAVTAFGQPVAELVSAPVNGKTFQLVLPESAPPARALVPVDNRLSWPGLIDFGKATASAQAAELKLFTYRDVNGDGKRQENEPLKEVRAQVGKGELFVVWASAPVTVTASRNYSADLNKGWNVMMVEVRGAVVVKPVDAKTSISLNIQ
ncbi:hypothetical protein [Deinococcus fonticola]|uniref:hypothetical protein n=1 Tax=Deinococcus fonticola TaxID=2528713 RepID=UPI001075052E|nr:hypothetical protein [Deinococcus fonticola]